MREGIFFCPFQKYIFQKGVLFGNMRTAFMLLGVVWKVLAFGQNFLMDGSPVTTCQGTFYDSGGSSGLYSNNQNLATVLCPGSGKSHIRLSFSGVALGPGDGLCFFDGTDRSAPLLACASNYPDGQPFVVQATATNPSGCLTAVFISDGSGPGDGWTAAISCTEPCQTIQAEIIASDPVPLPADTGWIDICPGEKVSFIGKGIYPQNNTSYAQSDATSRFEWQFGDGQIATTPAGSHLYNQSGGYTARLFITDEKGCKNTQLAQRRIRVSPRPLFTPGIPLPNPVCVGHTLTLSAATGRLAAFKNLSVQPRSIVFYPLQSRYDSLPLPDGIGTAYETDILLTNFPPNRILQTADDLEEICVNMEHSWARDLEIRIICPNGQSAVLHNFVGREGNKILLGEPNDNDIVVPLPGKGYDYCWSMSAASAPWLEAAGNAGSSTTLPAGSYRPFEPFSQLAGCPLNGVWSIRITDQWQSDNGFIFSWGLKMRNNLYTSPETFTPALQSGFWKPYGTPVYYSADSMAVRTVSAGILPFRYQVEDAFGCLWDTTLATRVLPQLHPSCIACAENFRPLRDTVVCVGEKVRLERTPLQSDTLQVYFAAQPAALVGHLQYPPGHPYAAPLEIGFLGYGTLTNAAAQLQKVCVDISTRRAADLALTLRSPDGKEVELSSGNGGSGSDYRQTCFSPVASASVVGAPAPLTGLFLPEGRWSTLDGAAVDGNWQLLITDSDGTETGVLHEWNMTFAVSNPVQYTWDPDPALSCTNCPAPLAVVQQNSTYRVTTRDAFGCVTRDSVLVETSPFFPPPASLKVSVLGPDFMTWEWPSVQGVRYEIRVNGGPWETPNPGPFAHTVSGLTPGDIVEVEVRAIPDSGQCTPVTAGAAQRFSLCTLSAVVDSVQEVRCTGDENGSVFISLENAELPAAFFPNGIGTGQPSGFLTGLFAAGPQFVVVRDALGCRDTVSFVIPTPAPLTLTVAPQAARCTGERSGRIAATASGGTGLLRYQWRPCAGGTLQTGATANNLIAGCYGVMVTDVRGCTTVLRTEVTEPPPLLVSATGDSTRCSGSSDGKGRVEVSGGTPGYRYFWSNGATLAAINNLPAGVHTVRVQDAANCEAVSAVFILQPPGLMADSTEIVSPRCVGDSTGSILVFPSGGATPYAYRWEDGSTTNRRQQVPAGDYRLTVTDAHQCTVSEALTIAAPSPMQLLFTTVRPQQCADSCDAIIQIRTSGGAPPYQLRWDDVVISKGDTLAAKVCAGVYPITVLDAKGCTQEDTLSVAAASPIVVDYMTTSPTCADRKDGAVMAIVNGGQVPYQYRWSNGSTSVGLTDLDCGTYYLTITDVLNCSITDTVVLACPDFLRTDTVVVKPVRCFGESSGELIAIPRGGHLPYLYVWDDPNRQADSSAMNLAAGTYTVTITDGRGCTATASASVPQPDPVSALLLRSSVRCFGGSDGTASIIALGGKRPFSYEWSTAQGDSTLTDLPKGNYSVTVKDANGCLAPAISFSIEEPATPVTAEAIQYKKACAGMSDGQALARGKGGTGAVYTFLWSNNRTDSLVSGLSPGLFTVQVSDENGCTDTAAVEIVQLTPVEISLLSVPTSCFDTKDGMVIVNLLRGGDGGGDSTLYRYYWSVPVPITQKYAPGVRTGRYYVTISDLQGCTDTDSIVVTAPRPLKPVLRATNPLCHQTATGGIRVSSVEGGNTGVFFYRWNTADSTILLNNIPAGLYTLTLTDSKGCKGSDSILLEDPPLLRLQLLPAVLKCNGDTTGFVRARGEGGTPGYRFLWETGDIGATLNGQGAGTYAVTLTDQNGCTVADSATIVAPDSLALSFTVKSPRCFGGEEGRIGAMLTGGTPPFRFSLNDQPLTTSSVFLKLKAGLYTLRTFDGNGCVAFDTVRIPSPLPVQVELPHDTTLVLGSSLDLVGLISNAIGSVMYEWKPFEKDTITCLDPPDCSEIRIQPVRTNRYRLLVTDAQGCQGEADVLVRVEKPRGVYVPTGFSPNEDGNNDLLVVHGISPQIRQINLFRVYDRWGELLWEDRDFPVNDLSRGWDGRFRNTPCLPGLYIWTLEATYIDGYAEALKGEVVLVR
jgi:gliding motility-associated-like protein